MSCESPGAGGLLLGIDVGSVNVKAVLCDVTGKILSWACETAAGNSTASIAAAILALSAGGPLPDEVRIAVTGGGRDLFTERVEARRVNEVVAAARGARALFPGARSVIDLGGQYSKWILLSTEPAEAGRVIDFATNGLCAAGSGAFLEQQASRLGLSLDDLGRAAARAGTGASIAGRCSVFAKSDMIHLQQKGTPVEEVAFGLCLALVRVFVGTVVGGREIALPVVLVGGGAANAGLLRAFGEVLGIHEGGVVVPPHARMAGALGAALMAVEAPASRLGRVIEAVSASRNAVGAPAAEAPVLEPLSGEGARAEDERLSEEPELEVLPDEVFLGVDVGSVSTNLALLDRDLRMVHGVYVATRGRPVDALAEGLARVRERFDGRLRVLGVGTTGSGRHLAAKLLGADVVRNEIRAQWVSAARFVPEVDTIFEIGGQDSKFISVRDGRLASFEMNKICAAGTGSFLEEQAVRLGVNIIGEFADLALRAARPPDLGARCTVFMDSELVRAQQRGATVPDLCAGLAYAVGRNYLEKVVAGRPIGSCIVFQGGTASNDSVVAALRRLLGRNVRVHPYNRISGAIGAALLAARSIEAEPRASSFRGLGACERAEVTSFECPKCDNRCQVNRYRLRQRVVHFGDACERYSERDRDSRQAPRPFASPFARREALLESFLAGGSEENDPEGRPAEPIGLLRASLNLEFLPFWAAFLRSLGFRPVVATRCTGETLRRQGGSLPGEVCLPIKAAAAQARALLAGGVVRRVFVPSILECPSGREGGESYTCLYNQELGDMLRADLDGGVVAAQFALRKGGLGLIEPSLELARALGRSPGRVAKALLVARGAQSRFDRARRALGREALAADFDRAVVVLGKPYNTHDSFLNLDLVRLLDRVGLPAIPWDMLPLDGIRLEPRWRAVPWHFNRQQLRAIEVLRGDDRLFPVLVSSYGCGPDAFVAKHLEELLAGSPRLLLEFDEHRAEAGLLTRLEAFADEIDSHLAAHRGRATPGRPTPGSPVLPRGRRFFVPHFSEHAQVYAAVLRSEGCEAEVLRPVDGETIRQGEEQASGRECHPYAVVAGEFCRFAGERAQRPGDVFLVPSCAAPCLLRQYGDGFRIAAPRLGFRGEIWDAAARDLRRIVGVKGILRLYGGLLATDVLTTLAARLRPYVRDREALEERLAEGIDRIVAAVAGKRDLDEAVAPSAAALWGLPRDGRPGERPVVGVTGDLYTRTSPAGNAGLFSRLEREGCEVWPSPAFAAMHDLGVLIDQRRGVRSGRLGQAAGAVVTRAATSSLCGRLARALGPEVADLVMEPPARRFLDLARPYVGPSGSHLVVHGVGKIADFLARGADGVISAAAINCMVGTAAASVIPRLREDHAHAPVIPLVYGASEGPAQRLRLETFVHQVFERRRDAGRHGSRA